MHPHTVSASSTYPEPSLKHILECLRKSGDLKDFFVPWHARGTFNPVVGPMGRFLDRWTGYEPTASVAPASDVLFAIKRRLGSAQEAMIERGEIFDTRVTNRLAALDQACTFIGLPLSSLKSFRTIRERGGTTVLLHVSNDRRFEEEFYQNLKLYGEKNISWPVMPPRGIERVEREIEETDLIAVPSRLVKNALIKRGVSHTKIGVIPYGVDTQTFHYCERSSESKQLRVVFVGQVDHRKGVHDLLNAVSIARNNVADVRIVGQVVGNSDVLNGLPEYVKHLGMMSHQQIAQEVFPTADVFVMPSYSDSFGLVALEAMSSGLPVIITRETGASELVVQVDRCLLVDAGAPTQIATVLNELAEDGSKRAEIGRRSRQLAQRHTWHKYNQDFAQFVWSNGAKL